MISKIILNIFLLASLSQAKVLSATQQQCFVPGGCIDSLSVELTSSGDEFECLGLCQENEMCGWFTFSPGGKLCLLFANCTTLDIDECQNCISGERGCQASEPKCWIQGQCDGNVIHYLQLESEIECLSECKNDERCKWFSYFISGDTCILFSDCSTFVESSEDFISGEQRCEEELVSTTTTTTPPPPTTTPPLTGYSKILVGVGFNGDVGPLSDVEIIDLSSSETTCQKLPDFPVKNYFATGGLGFQEKPLICGGVESGSSSTACWLFEDGVWRSAQDLNERRSSAAMTKSPFQQSDGSKLFVAGGYSSTEKLNQNGWEISIPLPVRVYGHCMVLFNLTSVITVGGYQDNVSSKNSFIFNSETNAWSEGPQLNVARKYHSCGLINRNNQSSEKSIIVTGGQEDNLNSFRSTEVLDLDSSEWRQGPDLPTGLHGAAMVEDPSSGGVVLIGGVYNRTTSLDTIYKLPHAGPDATWEKLPQKLKTGRYYHVAILVPDDITECT